MKTFVGKCNASSHIRADDVVCVDITSLYLDYFQISGCASSLGIDFLIY